MTKAQCSCGAISLTLPEAPAIIMACHCIECQRRTGAPFGLGSYYPAEAVAVQGSAKEYERTGSSGGKLRNYFCSNCGSTVYWTADKFPGVVGVAVGCLANPDHPPPNRSVYERTKHHWIEIDAEHFTQGSIGKG